MSVIPPEERQLHNLNLKLAETNAKLDKMSELLSAMNKHLVDIKGNTRKGGGIMGT